MRTIATPAPGPALHPGDPAPWFTQRSTSRDDYHFDTAAGRWLVLGFFATAGDDAGRAALAALATCRDRFDDRFASFFGVTLDPADRSLGRVAPSLPGVRFFWDFDAAVSAAYGVVPADGEPHGPADARRQWLVIDPMLRVHRVLPMAGPDAGGGALAALLARLPPPERFAGTEVPAPVLVLPQVLEPDLCARLIACYDAAGGNDSGFMREQDGVTVMVSDHHHKRRSDLLLQDPAVVTGLRDLLFRRVVPEIRKVFQFQATRMERFLIGCYDAGSGGHFRPHRDNTTRGTAHRRFAMTIGLGDDYAGGELQFPEFGTRCYRATTGLAIVFSCSLLHTVRPVTRGRRLVLLPFLYDEAAARQREANNAYVDPVLGRYRARPAPAGWL